MDDTFTITNGTRTNTPRVPFSNIKEALLGKRYTLSLVFVGETKMRSLNNQYRKKNEPTDILSFPYEKTSGEIILNQNMIQKKSKLFDMTAKHYTAYVFIHGLLHLKGHAHGRTMEKLEDTWCRRFNIPIPQRYTV